MWSTGGNVGANPGPELPTEDVVHSDGGVAGGGYTRLAFPSSPVLGVASPHSDEEALVVSDVILVATIVVFFLVVALVAWACSRITADADIEAELESSDRESEQA